ncbi:hypothetical protein WALSEDRAFT_34241, partial [Wallemia mellicola CBS 633.66]
MGLFDIFKNKHESAHQDVYGGKKHESHLSHELIGGAAAFEAVHAYEEHQRKEGKEVHHEKFKEIAAGLAAAEVDKLFETKGLDHIDKERAKHHAKQQVEQSY